MEDVFRFLMVRPPEQASVQDGATVVTPSEPLTGEVDRTPLSGGELRARLLRASSGRNWSSDPIVTKAEKISAALYGDGNVFGSDVAGLVQSALGQPAVAALDDPDFKSARAEVGDALIRGKLLGHAVEPRLLDLWRLVHVFDLVERCGHGQLDGVSAADVAALAARTVVLDRLPDQSASDQPQPTGRQGGGVPPSAGPGADRGARLRSALGELMALGPDALVQTLPSVPESGPALASPAQTPTAQIPAAPTGPPPGISAAPSRLGDTSAPALATATAPGRPSGFATATGEEASAPRLRLTRAAIGGLSSTTVETLRAAGVELDQLSLPEAVAAVSDQLRTATVAQLEASAPSTLIQLGNRLRPPSEAMAAADGRVVGTAMMTEGAGQVAPTSFGQVAPVGVGDLLVVRQHLKRYEAVDLSYVENILPSEKRSRVFTREQTTEQTTTITTEVDKQEERDQQTTERYELQTEADSVIKEEESLKAGVSVTSYGPMVEFKANADVGLTASQEQSAKVATKYSKEVTTKASTKITQKTSEQRTVKTTELYRETNEHGFDNTAPGATAIVGQYQFLNKVYEAQIYNYGKRLLFDFMVPEPAAYYTALAATSGPSPDLVKPDPFGLTPDQLDEHNYTYYVEKYAAIGVEAPPKPFTTVAPQPFDGSRDGSDKPDVTKTVVAAIPDGFVAIQAHLSATISYWDGAPDRALIALQVGAAVNFFQANGTTTAAVNMSGEIDQIPISCHAGGATCGFTANAEISCQRTDRALDAWRLKTHGTILQAYQQQLRDYQDKLAAFQAQQAAQVHGTNPAQNQITISTELRRQAISILTAQYFDDFGSLFTGNYGVPDIDFAVADAQGQYARFFEQAFEWERLMYFFYPYYWATKARWASLVRDGDDDPLFLQFLTAGFARVVVAVRPAFEYAVAHFLETGEVWNGGDLPPITSPLYLNIVEEVREADQAPGTETLQGDPWEVVLPTTLIKLRGQPTLPSWVHEPDGSWTPQ
jgi:hypothetical protein